MSWLLKDFFKPFVSDKVNSYKFVYTNCCIYIDSGQDRCMNCINPNLILSLRKRCIRAVKIRKNDNVVSGCIKNQLIVRTSLLA